MNGLTSDILVECSRVELVFIKDTLLEIKEAAIEDCLEEIEECLQILDTLLTISYGE